VGGDFYDMFLVNRDDLAVVLGDVAGKGVPAALLASLVHGAIRSSNWTASRHHHEQSLRQLNQLLLERATGERYVTMFSCYYDHQTEILHYINAGHCPPLLVHKTASESFDVVRLEEGGTVVGLLPGARFKQGQIAISPGDVLVMFSDGIVESANSAGEDYGEDRLIREIESHHAASMEVLRQRVIESVRTFAEGVPASDDLTVVIVRFSAEAKVHAEFTALTAAI
jgi:sigma-B regulation protein RsbU (phosphoserine phosphatase)